MNLPNKLTLTRVALIPLMVLLLYLPGAWCYAAAAVFALAAFTDYLDGHLARSKGLVTNFGRFLDPVADKLLVLSALAMLVHTQQFPAYGLIVILSRELCVDGLRMVAVGQGKVIAAGQLGKIKTVSQMFLVLYLILTQTHVYDTVLGMAGFVFVLGITLWSGIDYFMKNRTVISQK